MKVIRAKVLGFCMGVKKAVEAAENSLKNPKFKGKKIFSLGPLIHNPSVLSELENQGLKILLENEADCADSSSVVLVRAHGCSPCVLEKMKKNGAVVIDSTCPKVHLSQKRALEWHSKGFKVLIAGDKKHGEVSGILSYVDNDGEVVESAEEAKKMQFSGKIVLLAQTTFSPLEFKKICAVVKDCAAKENPIELKVFDSICSATMERQNALSELAGLTDGILVIGGKNSANTRRLYETASEICPRAALIENANEIPDDFFNMNCVGLSAGASTPDKIIDEVEMALNAEKN